MSTELNTPSQQSPVDQQQLMNIESPSQLEQQQQQIPQQQQQQQQLQQKLTNPNLDVNNLKSYTVVQLRNQLDFWNEDMAINKKSLQNKGAEFMKNYLAFQTAFEESSKSSEEYINLLKERTGGIDEVTRCNLLDALQADTSSSGSRQYASFVSCSAGLYRQQMDEIKKKENELCDIRKQNEDLKRKNDEYEQMKSSTPSFNSSKKPYQQQQQYEFDSSSKKNTTPSQDFLSIFEGRDPSKTRKVVFTHASHMYDYQLHDEFTNLGKKADDHKTNSVLSFINQFEKAPNKGYNSK